jgi:DnaJ-class molecular chaperone
MKTPKIKVPEKHCAACNGTGYPPVVVNTNKPFVRTYPPQCTQCLGKGRVAI